MAAAIRNLVAYRELMAALAWKTITLRYKQAYLGIGWTVLKPVALVLIFSLLRSFVNIDSGSVPYPVLAYAALTVWLYFQEATSEGVNSIVANAHLIRKIYFPREVFPVSAVLTKAVDLGINLVILGALLAFYGIGVTPQVLWIPVIVGYVMFVCLAVVLAGAALNVYYRDVNAMMPVLLTLLMYASPVIYPLTVVQNKLLVAQAAGEWSWALYTLYTLNPLAGAIDSFQRCVLRGLPPDPQAVLPGLVVTLVALPISYAIFKRAETYFADVI